MYCHKCGNQLPDNAVFCDECGAKLETASTARQPFNPSAAADETLPGGSSEEKAGKGPYGVNIKPYYCKQFERIASGQKPEFNWAALFFNGWIQLYNGCTGIFCKTFLPLLIVMFLVSLISTVAALNFNLVLIGLASVLSMIIGLASIALSIVNGFQFNKWYYQDVIKNPEKKRSRRGFWILLISEIGAIVMLTLIPYIFSPSYDDFSGGLIEDEEFEQQTGDDELSALPSGGGEDGQSLLQADTGNVNLSEIYINEAEGFSFRYPSAWVDAASYYTEEELRDYVVCLANVTEDYPEASSFIGIRKFPDSQDMADSLFVSDEEFTELFRDGENEVSDIETSVVELDGMPARMVSYIGEDDVFYQCYLYNVGSDLYWIDFTCMESQAASFERFFNAVIGSYTIEKTAGQVDYKAAYADKVRELAMEDDSVQFALINLTGSDVPELVAEHYGYDVSVFSWADGEIVTLMAQWPYGVGGNLGYEYLPGNNIIRNYNVEQAGAVIYELYMMVNDAYEVVEYPAERLSIRYFRDIDGNGVLDEYEEYSEEPQYYYGDTEISEEEYIGCQISGDFEQISGDLPAETILGQLEGES